MKRNAVDTALVPAQTRNLLTRANIPDAQHRFAARRSEQFPVGAELDGSQTVRPVVERSKEPAAADLPEDNLAGVVRGFSGFGAGVWT